MVLGPLAGGRCGAEHGQLHDERAAGARSTGQPQVTSEDGGDAARKGETETGTLGSRVQRGAHLEELLEHPLLVLFGDSDAGVLNGEPDHRPVALGREANLADLGELHCVAEQVAQHVPQQCRVGPDRADRAGVLDDQGHSGSRDQRRRRPPELREEHLEVDLLPRRFDAP